MGGGIGMGNTCKPMAVSFQCMTKSTRKKKKKFGMAKYKKKKRLLHTLSAYTVIFTVPQHCAKQDCMSMGSLDSTIV